MERDGFAHESLGLLVGRTGDAHGEKHRDVGAPPRGGSFVDHASGTQRSSLVNPACLRMLPTDRAQRPGLACRRRSLDQAWWDGGTGGGFLAGQPGASRHLGASGSALEASQGGRLPVGCAPATRPSTESAGTGQRFVNDHGGESGWRRFRTSARFEYECLRPTREETLRRYSNRESPADTSLGAVDVASMVDSVDVDDALVLVDPVDDAIRPDSRAVPAFELPAERVPDSVRVSNQTAEAELDDGPYDSW